MVEKARVILILSILSLFGCTKAYTNYCSISCSNHPTALHTACANTPEPKCRSKYNYYEDQVGLTNEERRRILNLHNKLRSRLSKGLETRGSNGPQPAAKYPLPDLEWDYELESIAQIWVNQCDYKHDECRDTANEEVGQNIGIITAGWKSVNGQYTFDDLKVDDFVNNWWNEVKDWNSEDTYRPFRGSYGPKVGHFTQMAWAKTTKIGCGSITFWTGYADKKRYVACNYGPSGNFLKKRMYIPYDDDGRGIELETWSTILPYGASNLRRYVQGSTVIINYTIEQVTSTLTVPLPQEAVIKSVNFYYTYNRQIAAVIKYYFNE